MSDLQTLQGFYTLFELSDPLALSQKMGLDPAIAQNQALLKIITQELLKALSQDQSGVVLDSEQGLPAYLEHHSPLKVPALPPPAGGAGLILRIDLPTIQAQPGNLPQFSPTWGVEHIRNNYAVALLELAYDPREAEALAKKQIVAEIGDYCHSQEIDFILKLSITADQHTTPPLVIDELQLTAIQELRSHCSLLALEPPQQPLSAATITAELDFPWIIMRKQSSYQKFKAELAQALENGALGYLAGEVLWQEMYQKRRSDQGLDEPALIAFISQEIPLRLKELNQMVAETIKV